MYILLPVDKELEASTIVEKYYPEEWEKMCEQDMYHASEYAEWFLRGRGTNGYQHAGC